jgi:hypothetical protein
MLYKKYVCALENTKCDKELSKTMEVVKHLQIPQPRERLKRSKKELCLCLRKYSGKLLNKFIIEMKGFEPMVFLQTR